MTSYKYNITHVIIGLCMFVWVDVFAVKFFYIYFVSNIYIGYEREQRIIYFSKNGEGFDNDYKSQWEKWFDGKSNKLGDKDFCYF